MRLFVKNRTFVVRAKKYAYSNKQLTMFYYCERRLKDHLLSRNSKCKFSIGHF